MNREDLAVLFVIIIAFSVGLGIGLMFTDIFYEKAKQLERELKYEREFNKALAEDNRWFRETLGDYRQKLWLESKCLNGTIKKYIAELEKMNDEAMTVNTLLLFYAYNSTINKTKLYWLDPDAEEHEKLLKKWGFDVR